MILGAEGAGKPEFKRSSWARRLSGPGRTAAGVCAATGMLTSLIPLITMDPPVLGRRQWSVLQMVLYQRVKPNFPPVSLKVWQFDFGAVYLLMLIVFVSNCFSASRKLISATSMLGAVYAYHLWRFAQMDLDLTFYGSVDLNNLPPFRFGQGVNLSQLVITLIGVMLAVLLVTWSDNGT